MGFTGKQLTSIAAVTLLIGIAWVWKLNQVMKATPPAVLSVSPHRWTEEEIRDTYERIKSSPVDWTQQLPPKLNRRYVITGGSGGVGGEIVLHLLARGEPPESIRIVDFRKPDRSDMMTGPATEVDFAQADISSAAATTAAFDNPWPPSVAKLPLTVFHTAAIIAASERSMRTYERIKRVNVDGALNVLNAAKAAGASVFISTSSASVNYRPVEFWGNPFRQYPKELWQAFDESDFDKPLRAHSQYFSNYAHSKAVAERLICEANTPKLRTGAIRPANGIYGSSRGDQVVGVCLRAGTFPTWMPNVVQNFVSGGHVSLAHLLFEAALVRGGDEMPGCAGRPFVIKDAGAPPMFEDMYGLLERTVVTPHIKVTYLQPGFMLAFAYVVELFDLASRMLVLEWIVPRPKGDLAKLQPAVFSACAHLIASDALARRSVDEGGLGYRPIHDTLEGMCQQVIEWNAEQELLGPRPIPQGVMDTVVRDIKNVGTMPAAVAG
ncbi:Uu.00g042650.m01.CDS01 [Anthostomella pinea]|uniref:Uu.00g042650.m01.CDS01 n=1 Tax=Anthostomella pinea TaxID=933095 RepID=A0AAI8VB49_9PEZI|nr:Uu.00g042650.m01.CDS01 [Anthostomella pinea]